MGDVAGGVDQQTILNFGIFDAPQGNKRVFGFIRFHSTTTYRMAPPGTVDEGSYGDDDAESATGNLQLLMQLLHCLTGGEAVPRPMPSPGTLRVCDSHRTPILHSHHDEAFRHPRLFLQAAVYEHLTVANVPRWSECSICTKPLFAPADVAEQHCAKHPPLCRVCLKRLLWCPFCREWIGPASVRHLCVRILRPPRRLPVLEED